jgi:hypothetical protein
VAEVFLSYSRDDRPVAQALAAELQRLGVDVWWDHDLLGGDDFRSRIAEILTRAPVAVVIWSRRSVQSQWVVGEASVAREKKILIPLNIDGCEPPVDFRPLHTVDFTAWIPGDQLPLAFQKALGERLRRELSYSTPASQGGPLGRITRQATQAWYLDLETMIFYLMSQAFACFLCTLPVAFLARSPDLLGQPGQSWPIWVPYVFSLMIGPILAPLVMRRALHTRRLPSAIPIFVIAAVFAVVSYVVSDALVSQLRQVTIVFVGPAMLIFLLTSALGDRSVER